MDNANSVLTEKIKVYRKEGLLPMLKNQDLKNMTETQAEKLIYYAELGMVKPATKIERNRIEIMIKKGFLPYSYKKLIKEISSHEAQTLIRTGDFNAEHDIIATEVNK